MKPLLSILALIPHLIYSRRQANHRMSPNNWALTDSEMMRVESQSFILATNGFWSHYESLIRWRRHAVACCLLFNSQSQLIISIWWRTTIEVHLSIEVSRLQYAVGDDTWLDRNHCTIAYLILIFEHLSHFDLH